MTHVQPRLAPPAWLDEAREVHEGVYRLTLHGVDVTLLLTRSLLDAVEPTAWWQLDDASYLPGLERVIITPDVHPGYAVPIGFTAVSRTHLYPDTVGPDPACSVSLSHLPGCHLGSLDKRAHRAILDDLQRAIHVNAHHPVGSAKKPVDVEAFWKVLSGAERPPESWVWGTPRLHELASGAELDAFRAWLETLATPARRAQFETMGGGNHFLEVQEGDDGDLYVMAHFGSRGLGAAGARWFESRMRDAKPGEVTASEPPGSLTGLPADTPLGRHYLLFQQAMLEYATVNHARVQATARRILAEHLACGEGALLGHIPHNVITLEQGAYWQRKGATPADPARDLPLLIPGSMATVSYQLAVGPNAVRFGSTVPHGAGRTLARGEAKRRLQQRAMDEVLERVGAMTNVRHVPLDEASAAYKDVVHVVDAVVASGVARVVQRLHPRLVLKGT